MVTRREIFIYALGCLSPFGTGPAVILDAMGRGNSCLLGNAASSSLPASSVCCGAGVVNPLERPTPWLGKPVRFGRLDRLTQVALLAAHDAITHDDQRMYGQRAGIALGTAFGSHQTNELFQAGLAQQGLAGASPALFAYTLPSSATAEISIHFGLQGPCLTLTQGYGAGICALGLAKTMIATGLADWMLAGAAEVLSTTLLQALSGVLQNQEIPACPSISPPPASPVEVALTEGAAFWVLGHDSRRPNLARVAGMGQAFGAQALTRAKEMALHQAQLTAPQVATVFGFDQREDQVWYTLLGHSGAALPQLVATLLLAQGAPLPLLFAAEDPSGQADVLCLARGECLR